jgi:hypothetical protein
VVTVSVNGVLAFNNNYPVYDGKVRLPKTLGVQQAGTAPGTPINISVVGFDVPQSSQIGAFTDQSSIPAVGATESNANPGVNGGGRILRSTTQPYQQGQIIYVPMPLHYSCYDVDCGPTALSASGASCGAGNSPTTGPCTCKAGLCVDPTVTDPTTEPVYNNSFTDSTANTCFRVFTDTNASGAKQPGCMDFGITPLTVDAAHCIYALPDSPSTPPDAGVSSLPSALIQAALTDTTGHLNSQNLNVRAVFDNYVSEVLDSEGTCTSTGPVEGYCTFPNAPQMFQLAPGLCAAQTPNALHKITLLEASAGCPAKTDLQPVCDDSTQGPPQPTLPDGGNSVDGGCNVAESLTPAPSLLYILWDRSTGMQDFFQSSAFSQVLGLSLSDPVFAQTQVAFSYTPAPQGAGAAVSPDCTASATSNTYATPLYPFQPSTQGQVTIANSLLNEGDEDGGVPSLPDGGLVLPQGPAPGKTAVPWYPEAALAGAYSALLSKAASSSQAYNRLAVMMFFDRDVYTNDATSNVTDCNADGLNHASAQLEAQQALAANGIETYVVYLKNQDYPNGAPAQWATNAQALAGGLSSSSQYYFNASTGSADQLAETEALALASVVSDLGSCVYENPGNLGPDAVLSYPTAESLLVSYAQNQPAFIQYASVVNATSCANDDGNKNQLWVYDNKHIRVCQNTCAQIVAAVQADEEHTASVNSSRQQQGLPLLAAAGITVSGVEPCEPGPIDASIVESGSTPTNYDAGLPSFDASGLPQEDGGAGEDAGTEDGGPG